MKAEATASVDAQKMALAEALARADSWAQNLGIRPAPDVARSVVSVLAAEVARLQALLQKAKQESELIRCAANLAD